MASIGFAASRLFEIWVWRSSISDPSKIFDGCGTGCGCDNGCGNGDDKVSLLVNIKADLESVITWNTKQTPDASRPINPTDFISLQTGQIVGGIPGSEGCGVVHEVGEGVTAVQKGQRVVTITGREVFKGNGSFQEYILLEDVSKDFD